MSGQRGLQGRQHHAICTGIAAQLRCSGSLPAAMMESLLHSTGRSYETTTAVSHQCSPVCIALCSKSTAELGPAFKLYSVPISNPLCYSRRLQHCRRAC